MTKKNSKKLGDTQTVTKIQGKPYKGASPAPAIPRRVLTIATIAGGLIGLALSQVLSWTIEQAFLMTLFIIGFAVGLTAMVYSLTRKKTTPP